MKNTKMFLILGFLQILRWNCIFNKNKLVFDPIDPFLMAKNANFYENHQNVSNPWFLAHLDNGIAYSTKIS